jgi:hypothetical protein
VLHIGAMKTGTTYLQAVLDSNRDRLAAGGVVTGRLLGRPSGATAKVLARPSSAEAARPWHELAERARRSPAPTAVISSEFLSFAKPHQIDALLRPFAGLRVEVVLVVRDQVGGLASQWQTFSRNFGDAGWPQYLRLIDPARGGDPASRSWRTYYRAQEIDRIVTDWGAHPGVAQLHVLPLPRSRAEEHPLWRAFAEIAGATHVDVEHPVGRVNQSVGHESAQMLQDLGRRWHQAGHPVGLVRQVMRPLIADALEPRRAVEHLPQLDRAGWDFAVGRNERALLALSAGARSGLVQVHGRMEDLTTSVRRADLPTTAPAPRSHELRSAARALWRTAAESRVLVPGSADRATGRPPRTYRGTLRAAHDLITSSEHWQQTVAAAAPRAAV